MSTMVTNTEFISLPRITPADDYLLGDLQLMFVVPTSVDYEHFAILTNSSRLGQDRPIDLVNRYLDWVMELIP